MTFQSFKENATFPATNSIQFYNLVHKISPKSSLYTLTTFNNSFLQNNRFDLIRTFTIIFK